MVHPVELSATCFPAARSFAARTCVAILLLSLGMLSGGKIWSQGFAPAEAVGKMTVAAGRTPIGEFNIPLPHLDYRPLRDQSGPKTAYALGRTRLTNESGSGGVWNL